MSDNISYYTKKTIESWDEVAPMHDSRNKSLYVDVANNNFNNLNPDFDSLIDRFDVLNKSVIQVCCNNGIDLLSIRNKGAGHCVGIDGSKEFIDQANKLSKFAGQPDIEYCCSDIYALPEKYINSFDAVVITVGVFNWMPDLNRFLEVCSSLLVNGGHIICEEIHPILNMYEEGNPSYITNSYFRIKPFRDTDGLDYFCNKKYVAKENYWFPHSLSEILMSAISNKLQLKHFKEIPYNVGNYCSDLEFSDGNPPLGINLLWQKNE